MLTQKERADWTAGYIIAVGKQLIPGSPPSKVDKIYLGGELGLPDLSAVYYGRGADKVLIGDSFRKWKKNIVRALATEGLASPRSDEAKNMWATVLQAVGTAVGSALAANPATLAAGTILLSASSTGSEMLRKSAKADAERFAAAAARVNLTASAADTSRGDLVGDIAADVASAAGEELGRTASRQAVAR